MKNQEIQTCEDALKIINVFHGKIHRIRLLVEMSTIIGDDDLVKNDQFFAFTQRNLIIGAVIIDFFAIFDDRKGSEIKKLQIISQKLANKFDKNTLDHWFSVASEYEEIRHKVFAHASTFRLAPFEIDYAKVLALLDELENVTKSIESECMNIILRNKQSVQTIASTIPSDCPVLLDLKNAIKQVVYEKQNEGQV